MVLWTHLSGHRFPLGYSHPFSLSLGTLNPEASQNEMEKVGEGDSCYVAQAGPELTIFLPCL